MFSQIDIQDSLAHLRRRNRNPVMDTFRDMVIEIVRSIPSGKVATYGKYDRSIQTVGQIARMAGFPNYSRHVAQILRAYYDSLPWHRVINSKGEISSRCPSSEEVLQAQLLQDEGIIITDGKINLKIHAAF